MGTKMQEITSKEHIEVDEVILSWLGWLPVAIAYWNIADSAVSSTGFVWKKTGKLILQRIDGLLHASRRTYMS